MIKYPYMAIVISVCIIAMLFIRRKYIIIPYIMALPLLSSNINMVMGTFNIWATDILSVLALPIVLIRCRKHRVYHFELADLIFPVIGLLIGLAMFVSGADLLKSFQSTWRGSAPWFMPYYIARFGGVSWQSHKMIFKAMIISATILSFMVIHESVTGFNIYVVAGFFQRHKDYGSKFGLFRSPGSMGSLHIAGMYLALVAILSLSMWFSSRRGERLFGYFTFPLLAVATFCTTSATGISQGVLGLAFMALYRFRKYWLVWTSLAILFTIFVEVVSNRHFYHVYISLLGGMGAGAYRSLLIDQTFFNQYGAMDGYWFWGHGVKPFYVYPFSYEDLCSQWVFFLVKAGLPGMLLFMLFFFYLFKRTADAYKILAFSRVDRIHIWGFVSILFSLSISLWLIALFGADIAPFAFFFGLTISFPGLALKEANRLKMQAVVQTVMPDHTSQQGIRNSDSGWYPQVTSRGLSAFGLVTHSKRAE